MAERFRRKVVHYMTSRGPVYIRTKGKEGDDELQTGDYTSLRSASSEGSSQMLEAAANDDCDMDIDDTGS